MATKTVRVSLLGFSSSLVAQLHGSFKSSKIINVLIMRYKFSWDSDRTAFLFVLRFHLVSFRGFIFPYLLVFCSQATP